MRSIGVIRRIDDLGRIVIPKEIRRQIYGTFEAAEGQPLEFFMEGNDTIILKPYKEESEWEEVKGKNNKTMEFHCECGCVSKKASNYCPDCGKRKSLPSK